jgi:UDP-N-acetylglucosamine--N-acetylmuramyl-(pentapeptide) pyrophosphoryl-undecaprenol N-acetylglucosamine transferase
MIRLMIAGGGTGGHLFPGVAVAEEFLRRDKRTKVLFVGTGRPVEDEVLGPRGLENRKITASGLKGKGILSKVRSLAALPLGMIQSVGLIRDFQPDMVLGVGGYVSGPVGIAAKLLGRATALHEQNSIPGLTNRLLGKLVDLIFISFESSAGFFPKGKTHLTGNPIRLEIASMAGRSREFQAEKFTLLVGGGSQGAHRVNEAALDAAYILTNKVSGFRVIHQTGKADLAKVREAYKRMGVDAEVQAFFHDMERVYQEADLAVMRAGALSIAEISAAGLPAIFIPLPTAADNHQEINARSLADRGAADMILQRDLNGELLADRILALLEKPDALAAMSENAFKTALPRSAERICDLCEAYLGGQGHYV